MTNSRLITRSACALGAAILATTALQSTPADAASRAVKSSGRSSGAHAAVKQAHAVSLGSTVRPRIKGGIKIPRGSRPPFDPGHVQFDPGSNKTPPIQSGTPTPAPIPPIAGPVGPLNPGGNKTPPVITATPTPAPIPPVTRPLNPGNYPGGYNTPPILSGTPTPAPSPVPVPTGSSPSPGYGTGYAHRHGQFRVYADAGAVGDSYAPCQWLRSNYDRTGNAYWLNRYKVCLWQH